MSRHVVTTESEARSEINANREKPSWREGRHTLPFHELSDDEFEVFCFLLLKREHPRDDIRYYGNTGDGGRDIVHRLMTPSGVVVRLIQCKRYESNVGVTVVRKDMAKLWVNVFNGTIPDRPNEVVFYAVPDLSNGAKNIIDCQDQWRGKAAAAIRQHLKKSVPKELARHAREWWPNPSWEAALSLTERAKKHVDLVEEFFSVRKVVDGGVSDVSNAVCERILPPLANIEVKLGHVVQAVMSLPKVTSAAVADLKAAFTRSSTGLLRWPTTLSDNRWLDRPELYGLVEQINSKRESVSVVLGPPGCGKSALLARFGQQMVSRGMVVLAIKADQLRNAVDSPAKLAERLDLPILTDMAVLAVAEVESVVVLLDQLDALADLADLKSERLHVLLNLVNKLSGHPGVHIVCSCREVEYQHDGRLGRIDASAIRLQPPSWEQVSEVLVAHNVNADGWPDDAKSLLKVPHNLCLFLNRLRGSGEHQVFTTFQQLFNVLWEEQVVQQGGGRAEFLYDLATQLAEEEELWIDRGRFEGRWIIVQELIAADILCLTEDGFRIGFRHQTLFEFIRAKSFARDNASIADYVLARQDALFVRPTLWMTLNYLRCVNPAVYAREFAVLWEQPSLRRHVKHLLIDFLSQVEQPPPTDWEQTRLIGALHDGSWRRKVLMAVTGKMVWFKLLAGSQLSAEMRKAPQEAGDVVWVLVAAFLFDLDRSLQLLEDNWLRDESKRSLVWETLNYLNHWSERAVEMAVSVVQNTAIEQGSMWHFVQMIAKSDPILAVRLVAAWLDAARLRIVSSTDEEGSDRDDQLQKLLDKHNQWHDLGKLAELVPAEFARTLLPVLRKITSHLRNKPSDYVIGYADDHLWFARLDSREYVAFDSPDRFFLALDSAMRGLARTQPEEFCALVRETGDPDSKLLQRLMCRGVREIACSHSNVAFEFLTANPRRFWLGGRHDDLGDSIDLIAALAPLLTSTASILIYPN